MDSKNKKLSHDNKKPTSYSLFFANGVALILILPVGAVALSLCAAVMPPIFALKYVCFSNSTVKWVLEYKIEKYDDKIKSFQGFSQRADDIYKSERFDANVKYCIALKEAYISLMSRKSSVELESRYHHKSTMKDDVFKFDKELAFKKFKDELSVANKNMLLSCVIEDTIVTNPLH
jgi:hypothetical protein